MAWASPFSSLVTRYYAFRQRSMSVRPWSALTRPIGWRGASLAIVGNAGYLKDLQQGALIDGHDHVLRMNNFQTRGLEHQVGKRTDVFFSTFWKDVRLDNPGLRKAKWLIASVPNNFQKRPEIHLRHGEQITAGLLQLGRQEVYVPEEEDFVQRFRQLGRQPTTGAMALFLVADHLLSACSRIYVTGFSFFQGKSHYYSDRQVSPNNHDLAAEVRLLSKLLAPLVASGRVKLDPVMSGYLYQGRAAAA